MPETAGRVQTNLPAVASRSSGAYNGRGCFPIPLPGDGHARTTAFVVGGGRLPADAGSPRTVAGTEAGDDPVPGRVTAGRRRLPAVAVQDGGGEVEPAGQFVGPAGAQ